MDTAQRKPRPKKPRAPKPRKSFFLRGLITILPATLTLFILVTVVQFAQTYVTKPINSTIYWALEGNGLGWKVLDRLGIDPMSNEFLDTSALSPELEELRLREPGGVNSDRFATILQAQREEEMSFFRDLEALAINPDKLRREVQQVISPWVGVLVSLVVVLTMGYFASGFLGRRAIAAVDRAAQNLPVIRSVYPYTKQLVEFFAAETEFDFDTVVAAPYPSEQVYCIAFVTSTGLKTVHEVLGERYVTVFVPTSPMPMTGFTVFIREDRLIPLPITVDEALRITVSAGVLIPAVERVEELESSLAALGAELEAHDTPHADEPPA
ncbi:MAG: DUF502 domain-containing protein [Planctomycetes bacterium]|nr:DUF502 domain-containing protein [Planctomycetota bacterium]